MSNADARRLLEQARMKHEAGDYRTARQMYASVVQQAPDSELSKLAELGAKNTRIDPGAIAAGSASVLVYLVAWILALR